MTTDVETDFRHLTADIVESYVSAHEVPVEQIPELIRTVHAALASAGQPPEPEPVELVPAVNPKRSVFEDYIVCLEDGKKLKLLKRHLMSAYNLTPDEYRAKWGLPSDYPMTAPAYSRHRTDLAHKIGLGATKGGRSNPASEPEEPEIPVRQIPQKRRGRPAKV
ncbi:MucR family transcriptional regulator [Gluconobacter cerevisiae]|uniref:MucR family transcriptional regulator n=1 Tax=Gluconobacter cerevisiae TaxID=1379734 RepID=A0ABR9YG50_9PROT|nr:MULTISPECIES: MucR family transcriptional regulator [Gluconobacter]MBF0877645.1 MucR family transcriptional regulator [Gluconobacter cerevisiae]MBS1072756.1 MucR family transcriptional regulator [Gluconobacter cerinus]